MVNPCASHITMGPA